MLTRAHKLAVELRERFATKHSRFLSAVGVGVPDLLAVNVDARLPLPVVRPVAHAEVAAGVVALLAAIAHVLGARRLPQIDPAIVGPVAVDVVDLSGWPLAGHNQPRQSVGYVNPVVEADLQTMRPSVLASGDLPSPASIPLLGLEGRLSPAEKSRFWVVIQKLAGLIGGEVVLHLNRHGLVLFVSRLNSKIHTSTMIVSATPSGA